MSTIGTLMLGCVINAVCSSATALECRAVALRVVAKAESVNANAADLVTMAAIESGFAADALSAADAVGVMQITAVAEAEVNQKYGTTYDRTNYQHNLKIAALYWKLLRREFDGDVPAMVAAYNAGPGRVWQHRREGTPLPDETVNHVKKFKRLQHQCSVRTLTEAYGRRSVGGQP